MYESLLNQSNSFKDVAFYVDTNKTQNLELLLGAADFSQNFLQWKMSLFLHLSKPASVTKIYVTDRSFIHILRARVV